MKYIKSEAAPDEYSSPFYIQNKDICKVWEAYILRQDGKIIGKFTSWALIIKAKINRKSNWYFELKKQTMTNSSLLLPSSWNVLTYTIIRGNNYIINTPSFEIKKLNLLNRIFIKFSATRFKLNSKYLIKSDDKSFLQNRGSIQILKVFGAFENLAYLKYHKPSNKIEMKFNNLVNDFSIIDTIII